MDAKKYLIETMEFYIHRLKTDSCTMAEMNAAAKALEENLKIDATLDDLSQFYGKSKTAVSSQIKRNLIARPKKNVTLYPFQKFRKIIPPSWRKDD